jgi:hypothetical protein
LWVRGCSNPGGPILVSAALVRPLDLISAEAVIAKPPPSITADPNARREQPSSDHAPVVASFANP